MGAGESASPHLSSMYVFSVFREVLELTAEKSWHLLLDLFLSTWCFLCHLQMVSFL